METYLFDCNEDLYGEYCKVDFYKNSSDRNRSFLPGSIEGTVREDAGKAKNIFAEIILQKTFVGSLKKRGLHARSNVLYYPR